MKNSRDYPNLNDLAFSGRNKVYGSYYLRKRYQRFLLVSFLLGSILFFTLVLIPFLIYYFQGSELNVDMNLLYSVEYDFIASPDNQIPNLANLPKEETESEQAPVVADSVPEKVNKEDQIKPDEKKEDESSKDSLGNSKGHTTQGTGPGEDQGIYTTLDVFPKYPGGDIARLTFLRNNIRYPDAAQKAGLQGVVMVVFVIETDGSVSRAQVTKGIGAGCDEEALRVTNIMPVWEPGRRSGKPVRVMVRMPIVFKLPVKIK
jgi:periplasmic protein TonB